MSVSIICQLALSNVHRLHIKTSNVVLPPPAAVTPLPPSAIRAAEEKAKRESLVPEFIAKSTRRRDSIMNTDQPLEFERGRLFKVWIPFKSEQFLQFLMCLQSLNCSVVLIRK